MIKPAGRGDAGQNEAQSGPAQSQQRPVGRLRDGGGGIQRVAGRQPVDAEAGHSFQIAPDRPDFVVAEVNQCIFLLELIRFADTGTLMETTKLDCRRFLGEGNNVDYDWIEFLSECVDFHKGDFEKAAGSGKRSLTTSQPDHHRPNNIPRVRVDRDLEESSFFVSRRGRRHHFDQREFA